MHFLHVSSKIGLLMLVCICQTTVDQYVLLPCRAMHIIGFDSALSGRASKRLLDVSKRYHYARMS